MNLNPPTSVAPSNSSSTSHPLVSFQENATLSNSNSNTSTGRRPQFLPKGRYSGAASLYEQLEKSVLVCLRDGRLIVGSLRSYDQYANLVLESAYERIIVGDIFGDTPLGIFLIRGENVMFLGEVDPAKEHLVLTKLQQVSSEEIQRAKKAQVQDAEAFRRREKFEWPIQDDFF